MGGVALHPGPTLGAAGWEVSTQRPYLLRASVVPALCSRKAHGAECRETVKPAVTNGLMVAHVEVQTCHSDPRCSFLKNGDKDRVSGQTKRDAISKAP